MTMGPPVLDWLVAVGRITNVAVGRSWAGNGVGVGAGELVGIGELVGAGVQVMTVMLSAPWNVGVEKYMGKLSSATRLDGINIALRKLQEQQRKSNPAQPIASCPLSFCFANQPGNSLIAFIMSPFQRNEKISVFTVF